MTPGPRLVMLLQQQHLYPGWQCSLWLYWTFPSGKFFPQEKSCKTREKSDTSWKKSLKKNLISPLVFSSETAFYLIPANVFIYQYARPLPRLRCPRPASQAPPQPAPTWPGPARPTGSSSDTSRPQSSGLDGRSKGSDCGGSLGYFRTMASCSSSPTCWSFFVLVFLGALRWLRTRISSSSGGLTVGSMSMAKSTACLQYASFVKCAQEHL